MKYAGAEWRGATRVGRVDGDELVLFDPGVPVEEAGVAALIGRATRETGERAPLSSVRLLAPIPPPRRDVFLQPGDVMRVEIGGIGVLENPLVAA